VFTLNSGRKFLFYGANLETLKIANRGKGESFVTITEYELKTQNSDPLVANAREYQHVHFIPKRF
jgi:hypothetical protein